MEKEFLPPQTSTTMNGFWDFDVVLVLAEEGTDEVPLLLVSAIFQQPLVQMVNGND
jgi:hypothetical protein